MNVECEKHVGFSTKVNTGNGYTLSICLICDKIETEYPVDG